MLTGRFLGLKQGDIALLCMPLKYIAGKMVVVRALVAGLNLLPVAPCGHPLAEINTAPELAAMIPMQVYNSLQVSAEKECLKQVRHLIIGGGAIDSTLSTELASFPYAVWSTYGMTETLSHIALRRLNGPNASDWYTPFQGVKVSLSPENTLTIEAPAVCAEKLITNDICEFNAQGQFHILGRKDNTINTGGVKVQIEQVEHHGDCRARPEVWRMHRPAAGKRRTDRCPPSVSTGLQPTSGLLATETDLLRPASSTNRNRKTRPCHRTESGPRNRKYEKETSENPLVYEHLIL